MKANLNDTIKIKFNSIDGVKRHYFKSLFFVYNHLTPGERGLELQGSWEIYKKYHIKENYIEDQLHSFAYHFGCALYCGNNLFDTNFEIL